MRALKTLVLALAAGLLLTGCTKQSAGCAHCYAEVMARRLTAMGLKKYENGFKLTLHPDDLEEPKKWKKGSNIFIFLLRC